MRVDLGVSFVANGPEQRIPERQRAAVPVNGTNCHCLENGAAGSAHGRQTAMPSRNIV